ncbi:DUF3090 domain-containing protein [Fodinicola feengrottensis]|uniref:DUF3090 domain-containing protein n=1 Tax=Fodinicola feengrottensis TaxID=435914 RepID=A0ABN2HTZ6_9ACTN
MPRQVYSFEPPERFIAGTVGEPGDRTFYLQASGGGRTVSVALEKVQVALLAERLAELLDEARRRLGAQVPDGAPELEDSAPLDTPIEEEFRVGTLGLAWEGDSSTVVIEATAEGDLPETEAEAEEELVEVDPEDDVNDPDKDIDDTRDVLRVRISPAAARAFISRAERVVAAGRPACPLCGLPLDPEGHICPRHNGYRR